MAKRQTRRSISVKGITYQRLKDYCDATGKSVSGYLEDIIAEKLDAAGAPIPTVLKARPQRKDESMVATTTAGPSSAASSSEPEEIVSQHFTF
ncbi:hypothetical protein ACNOYE_12460 [Nannocystaceae bacterium ST9]